MNLRQVQQPNQEKKSRTEYSARNTSVAMFARVVAILMGFFTRVVFTKTLSEAYVGINGLFTDILNVLALSELGVGTAITYALYKPISEEDVEKQKSLMRMYQNFYRIVAVFVLIAGLLIVPFMDILVKDNGEVEHLVLIYLMYLANSVISYLYIYKKTLIDAHQLSYIGVIYQTVFLVLQNVLQIIVLLTTKNFVLFVAVMIGCTILNNISVSVKADKLYPYLKDKKVQPLPETEKKSIYQNIKAMLMHKVGNVVVSNTDNLLLSSLVGIVSAGMYSNYYLIIGSVRQVLNQIFQGITASVGNLGVEESKERVKRIFDASYFAGQWAFGFAAICLFEILSPFVIVSFGENYVFSMDITLVLCLNFYFTGMRQATLVFRDSLGLFRYDRYKSIAEAVINLAVSVILGYYLGTIGIFLGTLISTLTTSMWVEPYILYKYHLKSPVRFYFIKYAIYMSVTFGVWWLTDFLCGFVQATPLIQCILRFFICLVVPNICYLLIYGRTKEFIFVWRKAKGLITKWMHKTDKNHTGNHIGFTQEEEYLLYLVKCSLQPEKQWEMMPKEGFLWEKVFEIAENHRVLPLLYDLLIQEEDLTKELRQRLQKNANQTVLQQYRLLFLSKSLVEILEQETIKCAILKGVTIGEYFPVPELRKSGDIDLLLLEPKELDKAKEVLLRNGFLIKEEQLALHHLTFTTEEGIDIEMHTMLAEPFDNEKMNAYLRNTLEVCKTGVSPKSVLGVELPVLSKAYFGFELLLHMLQHFLRSGFGLKLLCDWVVFWEDTATKEEQEVYLRLVTETGIKNFSDIVTLTCIQYLGMDAKKVKWMEYAEDYSVEAFLKEILIAEEFGKSDVHRMVVMRGTGVHDYVREFHHQMCLNFPKAGKCFLLWPILWIVTFVRFYINNRRLRNTSMRKVLKEAAKRSRLMDELNLFQ